jgi:hypothetical protein
VALDSRFVANQSLLTNHFLKMAEGVGFEPTRACALPVFKTGAINHSTTPPGAREVGVIDLNRPRAVW